MAEGRGMSERLETEPMDPQITSIQPGGGICMRLELAWGRWRRWYLKTFRKGYVRRMAALRRGEASGCPHEVIDSRDLKFYQNQGDCHWAEADDPFRWRDRLPFARAGLAELLILCLFCFALGAVSAFVYWPAAGVAAVLGLGVMWFFRNPRRTVPVEEGAVVSPADGRVTAVEEVAHDDFIEGPAIVISIFLSIFNVHINRVPLSARVIGVSYRRGRFLNALRPASARENERITLRLEENTPPYRRAIVRQIAGAIARRIVCRVRPGDELPRGSQFGMIKFGSRTELVLPREPDLAVVVRPGDQVKAGTSVLAHY